MSQSTTELPTLILERTGSPVELIVFVLSLASVFALMLAPPPHRFLTRRPSKPDLFDQCERPLRHYPSACEPSRTAVGPRFRAVERDWRPAKGRGSLPPGSLQVVPDQRPTHLGDG